MNSVKRLSSLKSVLSTVLCRASDNRFSTSSVHFLKEVVRKEVNGVMTVEAVFVPSGRESTLIKYQNDPSKTPSEALESSTKSTDMIKASNSESQSATRNDCPLCKLGLPIRHTDVLILSQFVRSDGCMLPRRVTGLCKEQHKRVNYLVAMAHKAGLMPNLKPKNSHKDPKRRWGWNKFNKYYDEAIIDEFLNPRSRVKKA